MTNQLLKATHTALLEDPDDELTRFVLADLLEELGDDRSLLVRGKHTPPAVWEMPDPFGNVLPHHRGVSKHPDSVTLPFPCSLHRVDAIKRFGQPQFTLRFLNGEKREEAGLLLTGQCSHVWTWAGANPDDMVITQHSLLVTLDGDSQVDITLYLTTPTNHGGITRIDRVTFTLRSPHQAWLHFLQCLRL